MARTVLRERPRSALVRPVESMANWRPRQLSQMGPRLMIFLAVSRMLSLGFSGFQILFTHNDSSYLAIELLVY